jgi:hypothetical protein
MSCKNCKYWHGRGSDWGDCYRIIGQLNPNLFTCKDDFGNNFKTPFDPHDVKYFRYSLDFINEYKLTCNGVPQVQRMCYYVNKEKVKDIVYNDDYSERLGVLTLHYFRTHKDYKCEEKV